MQSVLKRSALGAAAAYFISVGSALVIFGLGDRASTSEYPFLLASSVPPALLVMPLAKFPRGGLVVRSFLCLTLGIALAISWTFVAFVLTGGYLMAADFPVLWNWTCGGVVGLLIATLPWTARGAIAGVSTIGLIAVLTGALYWGATRPHIVVDVVFAPTASPQDIDQVWKSAIGRWEKGKGRTMADGIEDYSERSIGNSRTAHINFSPFASKADSAALDARLKNSGLVLRIKWYRESP